jgi:short-subunit dehydrogenase
MSRGLIGKTVLITGGSSGIGAKLAHTLARRGAAVGILARRAERLESVAGSIIAAGGRAGWAVADVRDTEGLGRALDALERELGGVDVVVANAGYALQERPDEHRDGAAEQLYDVNLFGMLRLIDWALPRFVSRGSGQIVGIASAASYLGLTQAASYCGSKAAMRIHLQALRVSLKRHGIAVTTICPGFVVSEMTTRSKGHRPLMRSTDEAARAIAKAIERKRAEFIWPWQVRFTVALVKRLPRAWVEWLVRTAVRRR